MAHRPLSLVTGLSLGCLLIAPSLCLAEAADWDARLAQAAQLENETKEDIGARRLHTLFEKMLEDISFNAGGDMPDVDVTINGEYVAEHLGTDAKKMDMRQYIL